MSSPFKVVEWGCLKGQCSVIERDGHDALNNMRTSTLLLCKLFAWMPTEDTRELTQLARRVVCYVAVQAKQLMHGLLLRDIRAYMVDKICKSIQNQGWLHVRAVLGLDFGPQN